MSWFKRKPAEPAPQQPEQAGTTLLAGRFRLGARIAEGASGLVHEALDLRTGGPVAVKLLPLPPGLPGPQRKDWVERLQREAALGRQLNHPDIIAVLDVGLTGTHAWMAMERVHGADLGRYTRATRLLPESVVLHIGARVADALAHAHACGVVHRDLKPANVLVDLAHDRVKVADFGVARTQGSQATLTGMTLGTPSYMAPEMLAGATASPASDAYALGVMLFELLTGRRPHQAESFGELLRVTAREAPTLLRDLRPDLPPTVCDAVQQLMARVPSQRPQDLGAWAAQMDALASLMAKLQGVARPSSP